MLTWFIIIALEVYRNWYMIEKQKSVPNYFQSFIIRGIAAILHGVYMDLVYGILQVPYSANYKELLIIWAPLLIFQVSTFYVLFDAALNFVRHKPFFYIGKGNFLDRWGREHENWYWVVKLVMFLVAVYCVWNFNMWI